MVESRRKTQSHVFEAVNYILSIQGWVVSLGSGGCRQTIELPTLERRVPSITFEKLDTAVETRTKSLLTFFDNTKFKREEP